MRLRRASAVAAAAAGAATAAWAALVEPRLLRVRRVELTLPGWPAAHDGLRVAVASDLHAGGPHTRLPAVARVVAAIAREAPDLVALLGDFTDFKLRGGPGIAPERVAERLGALRPPLGVLAVLGNHDWRQAGGDRTAAALRAHGITVLEETGLEVAPGLAVIGLGDLRTRDPDPERALAHVPPDAAVLCLAHDPDVFPAVPARVALTLAGHTHGGQVNIPRLRALFVPSRHGERYADGLVVEGGRHLFVTRGIGMSGWPVRLLAPPEVVVLTLRGAGW